MNQVTRQEVEQWLETERKRMGLQRIEMTSNSRGNGVRYYASMENDAVAYTTFEKVEKFASEHNPEAARLNRISELRTELEELEGKEKAS